jgi:hypothetical protein
MRLTGAGWSMAPGDKTKTTRLRLVPRVLDPCHESCAGFRPSQQAERLATPVNAAPMGARLATGIADSLCTPVRSPDDAGAAGMD